ncbi:MAG: endonuclease III [Acidimicrobiales bacterium]
MARPRTPKGRARETMLRLAAEYPGSATDLCELDHANAFQLLAATILSAQSTDKMVNSVTPQVFQRWPTPQDLAAADPAEVEEVVHSTGFFRSKTKSLIGMAQAVTERFEGEVPSRIEDLVTLPGVGRKTANVLRSVGMNLPGLPVDTHVLRLSGRLGLTTETDPVKVEHELNAMIPAAERGAFSLRMILHGRRVCDARRPACDRCSLADFCPASWLPTGKRRTTPRG